LGARGVVDLGGEEAVSIAKDDADLVAVFVGDDEVDRAVAVEIRGGKSRRVEPSRYERDPREPDRAGASRRRANSGGADGDAGASDGIPAETNPAVASVAEGAGVVVGAG
jgi:hypothetical protein